MRIARPIVIGTHTASRMLVAKVHYRPLSAALGLRNGTSHRLDCSLFDLRNRLRIAVVTQSHDRLSSHTSIDLHTKSARGIVLERVKSSKAKGMISKIQLVLHIFYVEFPIEFSSCLLAFRQVKVIMLR